MAKSHFAPTRVGEFVRIEAFIAQIGELLTTLWQRVSL